MLTPVYGRTLKIYIYENNTITSNNYCFDDYRSSTSESDRRESIHLVFKKNCE